MRVLVAGLLCLLAACATAARDIQPSANATLALRRVHDTLVERGFQCSLDEQDLTCEGDRTYKVVIKYLTAPNRLLFYAWFETDKSCADHGPAIAEYNERYLIQLSCVDDMLRFFSSTYVPEAGLGGAELESILVSWSDEIHSTATEVGLFGAADPAAPAATSTSGEAQTL
jgi:hypothetical protein